MPSLKKGLTCKKKRMVGRRYLERTMYRPWSSKKSARAYGASCGGARSSTEGGMTLTTHLPRYRSSHSCSRSWNSSLFVRIPPVGRDNPPRSSTTCCEEMCVPTPSIATCATPRRNEYCCESDVGVVSSVELDEKFVSSSGVDTSRTQVYFAEHILGPFVYTSATSSCFVPV